MMAIAMFRVTVGKKGKALPHYSYITAQKKYAKKSPEVLMEGSGNMPDWAEKDPSIFWELSDLEERANGSVYREHLLSLPREFNFSQNLALVQEWIDKNLGNKHPYTFAIHNPKTQDGLDQPHCHLMFCERINDNVKRTPAQFFKRYNAKNPEKGGARKDNTGLTHQQRQENLLKLRQDWGEVLNAHLLKHGFEPDIDMRNWKERGLTEKPVNKSMVQIQIERRITRLESEDEILQQMIAEDKAEQQRKQKEEKSLSEEIKKQKELQKQQYLQTQKKQKEEQKKKEQRTQEEARRNQDKEERQKRAYQEEQQIQHWLESPKAHLMSVVNKYKMAYNRKNDPEEGVARGKDRIKDAYTHLDAEIKHLEAFISTGKQDDSLTDRFIKWGTLYAHQVLGKLLIRYDKSAIISYPPSIENTAVLSAQLDYWLALHTVAQQKGYSYEKSLTKYPKKLENHIKSNHAQTQFVCEFMAITYVNHHRKDINSPDDRFKEFCKIRDAQKERFLSDVLQDKTALALSGGTKPN